MRYDPEGRPPFPPNQTAVALLSVMADLQKLEVLKL